MSKIAIIIDKSQSYIDLQKEIVLEKWGVNVSATKKIGMLSEAGSSALFGPPLTSILYLEDIDSVKKLLTDLTKNPKIEKILSSGLLIYTSVNRNSTKKLEKLITELGGEVIVSKLSSKDTMTSGQRLISDMGFNSDVRSFLLEHVGQDYESLIPIVRSFSNLSKKEQREVSLEEVYIRLPQPPGSVPPWEIEKPLVNNDSTELIRTFRRIHSNSDLLVVLAILRNKFQLAYRAGVVSEHGVTQANTAEALQVKDGYPLKLAISNYKKYGQEKIEKAVNLLAKLETDVKGGSAVAGDVIMEVKLIELQKILRSR